MDQSGQQQAANMAQDGQVQAMPDLRAMQQRARAMYGQLSDDQKNGIRFRLLSRMNPEQRQVMRDSGRDPLMQFCVEKAQDELRQRMQQMPGQQDFGNMQIQMENVQLSESGGQSSDVSEELQQQAKAPKLEDAGDIT